MNPVSSLLFNAESFFCVKSFSYNSYLDHLHLIKSAISPTTADDYVNETNGHKGNITNTKKSAKSVKSVDCFFKSFQFAPDGYAAISWTECNNKFQVWDLNKYCQSELIKSKYFADDSVSIDNFGQDLIGNNLDSIQEYFHEVQSGESIYDCKWYPYASTTDISSYCFASSCRDHPIHIWVFKLSSIK